MGARNPRRGVHLPNTQGARLIQPWEYEALGELHVGSVSLLDFQLTQDDALVRWLARRAQDGLEAYVRIYHNAANGIPDPAKVAEEIKNLSARYPFVRGWIPANEQNIEGWPDWAAVDEWNMALWYHADWYRQNAGARFTLYYPPFAQDAPLNHYDGWERCASSIRHYLDNGDGFSWHDYWWPGSDRLIEQEAPSWLLARLYANRERTLIHECGRLPGSTPELWDCADELIDRFGSETHGSPGRSLAHAATPWLLASRDPAFDAYSWVDEEGGFRQIIYTMRSFGP